MASRSRRRGLHEALLAALRFPWRPPVAVRKALRPILARIVGTGGRSTGSTSWSRPIFDRGPPHLELDALLRASNQTPHQGREERNDPLIDGTALCSPSDRGNRLRCVLAAGASGLGPGGLGEVVALLATRLPAEGIDPLVLDCGYAPDSDPQTAVLRNDLERAGIPIVDGHSAGAIESLRRWQPDIVNSHGSPSWVLDFAAEESIAHVETLHGMHDFMRVDWEQEAVRSEGVTVFIAVSELVRRQYLQGNPRFQADRVITIPNAANDRKRWDVDRERARAALGIADEFIFLSLSRFCIQKNVVGLVSAFDGVARTHADAHLLVSGHIEDPLDFGQAQMEANSQSSADQIHLREHTTAPAVLLAAADAFVLDSFFEGWALASMEALHAGLPVIMSEVGGAIEQIGHGRERGFVVPNPLGNTDLADWDTMRIAAYSPQPNAEALEQAMERVVRERRHWSDRRSALKLESASRFRPEVCANTHAKALRRATSLA